MSVRELVVLGTASQVPTRHRNHNGYFVRWDSHGLLFDPGEATQRQMIHHGVTATSITNVLITHFHGDHCLGLASLVQRISLDQVPHPVHVFFPESGEKYFHRLRSASIFHDVSDLRPRPVTAPGELARHRDLSISCQRLDHGVDCYGYRIEEPDQWSLDPDALAAAGLAGPIVGELKRKGSVERDGRTIRVEDVGTLRRGQSLAVVMDTRRCPGAVELAKDVDLLICESTYLHSEAAEARNNRHLTARQAAEIAVQAGAKQLVLTHFSQRYTDASAFATEAGAIHPNVVAAHDGLVVPIRRNTR